jgi:hypothetical protein
MASNTKKCNHRAEIISNVGYLGVDFYNGRKADKSLQRLLHNHIKNRYQYILFPNKDGSIELRYLSINYTYEDGIYTIYVGVCIHINQSHTGDPKKPKWHYSENISIQPIGFSSGYHIKFYKDVWKNLDNVRFAPIRYSFGEEDTICKQITLEFVNFSSMILYLSKYEYYMKLQHQHHRVKKCLCWHHSSCIEFTVHSERFMSETYAVNITPFNKYFTQLNINIDSSLTISDVSPQAQPWTLKKLCWFFVKNYYKNRYKIVNDALPSRFVYQLRCIEFDRYFVKWSYEQPSNSELISRLYSRRIREQEREERERDYRERYRQQLYFYFNYPFYRPFSYY